jgi:hypothetical protein
MKKKFIKKFLSTFAVIVASSTTIFAQMNYFTLPPRKWDVSTYSASNSAIPSAPNYQHMVTNGAYDETGNLLFYIVNTTVYNSSSSSVGNLLSYYVDGTLLPCSNIYSDLGPEISIVPIPNTCKQYFVIYSMGTCNTAASNAKLLYMKVDCSSGSPVLSSPTEDPVGTWPYRHLIKPFGVTAGGLAVSKLLPGNASRYLFSLGNSGQSLFRYTITASGLSAASTVTDNTTYPNLFSTSNTYVNEMDLSPNGQYIAWGGIRYGDKVRVVTLNSSYNATAGTYYNFSYIKGVEFEGSNSRLFVSSDVGISRIQLSTGVVTTIASSTAYNNTAIELAYNGRLYFVNNSGALGQIVSPNGAATITAAPSGAILSNGACGLNANDNAYRLNDQVDGENYNYYGVGYAVADGTDFCGHTTVTASVVAYLGSVQWQQKLACTYDQYGTPTTWADISGATSYSYGITTAYASGTALRARIACNGSTTYTNAVVIYGITCGQSPLACYNPMGRTAAETKTTEEPTVFSVNVYPNPSEGIFKLDAEQDVISVEVYNTLGALVFKTAGVDAKQATVDISKQPKGLYFMKIANANGEILNKNIAIQ